MKNYLSKLWIAILRYWTWRSFKSDHAKIMRAEFDQERQRLMERESEAVMQANRDAARADANAAEASKLRDELAIARRIIRAQIKSYAVQSLKSESKTNHKP